MWVTASQTEFEIKTPISCGDEGKPCLLVTVDQEIDVVPLNTQFVAGDGYMFTYKLEEDIEDGKVIIFKDN